MRWIGLLLMIACEEQPLPTDSGTEPAPFVAPCAEEGEGVIEVALAGEPYGSLSSGEELWCGTPPQGGAPFTPLVIRMRHLPDVREGTTLRMVAVDLQTGETVGDTELIMGFTCANVGENTDWWVGGGEAHLRYSGHELSDLDGREVELQLTVSNSSEEKVVASYQVFLVL